MNKRKNNAIIISAIIITIAVILIITNLKNVNAYGLIKQENIGYTLEAEVTDCESLNQTFIILNPFFIGEQASKKIQIKGQSLMNYLIIYSINTTFNPGIDCFIKHESDITIEPLNYQVSTGVPEIIKYNVTNNQDLRLFYDCRLITDCNLSRAYYTGYLSPGEYVEVFFNVTCSQGVHDTAIKTVFLDELMSTHTVIQNITINAE